MRSTTVPHAEPVQRRQAADRPLDGLGLVPLEPRDVAFQLLVPHEEVLVHERHAEGADVHVPR